MPEEKDPPVAPAPVTADPVQDPATDPPLSPAKDSVADPAAYDAFAEQVAKAAVWSDAAKAQLPKKPT